MKKVFKIFIVIIAILLLVLTINKIGKQKEIATVGEIGEAQNKLTYGVDLEGQIYIIGTHAFTEKTPYLSTELMLEAAKTDPAADGLTETEEILDAITVYARDAEGNWIDALKGEKITLPSNYTFNIEYIDGLKIKISDAEEFKNAFTNPDQTRIELAEDIVIPEALTLTATRELELNLNGKTLTFTNDDNTTKQSILNEGKLVINGNGGKIVDSDNNSANETSPKRTLYNSGSLEIKDVTMEGDVIFTTTSSTDSSKKAVTTIDNCEIVSSHKWYCIVNYSNAETNVNKSRIEGMDVLLDNGTHSNSYFNVTDSEIIAGESGIYKPANGGIRLERSKITAPTGVIICAGDLEVIDSEIHATGAYLRI